MKRPWQYITRLKVSHYNCRPHCMPDLQVTRRLSSLACPTLLHVPKPLKTSQDMPCPQTRHRWTACCGTCWMSDGPAGMCMHPAATPRHHTSWDIGHLRHDFGHRAFSQSVYNVCIIMECVKVEREDDMDFDASCPACSGLQLWALSICRQKSPREGRQIQARTSEAILRHNSVWVMG